MHFRAFGCSNGHDSAKIEAPLRGCNSISIIIINHHHHRHHHNHQNNRGLRKKDTECLSWSSPLTSLRPTFVVVILVLLRFSWFWKWKTYTHWSMIGLNCMEFWNVKELLIKILFLQIASLTKILNGCWRSIDLRCHFQFRDKQVWK